MPPESTDRKPLNWTIVSVCVNWSGPAFATGPEDPASVVEVVDVVVMKVVVVTTPNVVAPATLEYSDAVPFLIARTR